MPLARSLAMRYRRQTESLDDLVQVAGLGLVKAVDGFDPGRERPFAAYAVPTILGELRRHFRDHVWNVRLPRALQERTMKLDAATAALTDELGRFPTPDGARRAARHLGRGRTRGARGRPRAADAVARRAAPQRRGGRDARPSRRSSRPRVATTGSRRSSPLAAAELDEREWAILRMRFVDDLTQREIAAEFDVSQMQISRISRRALWKLLSAVHGDDRDAPVPKSGERPAVG